MIGRPIGTEAGTFDQLFCLLDHRRVSPRGRDAEDKEHLSIPPFRDDGPKVIGDGIIYALKVVPIEVLSVLQARRMRVVTAIQGIQDQLEIVLKAGIVVEWVDVESPRLQTICVSIVL